jgi:hypothetical protein
MNTHRRYLSLLALLPVLALLALPDCGVPQTPATVLSEVEAGVNDAEVALQIAAGVADSIFAAKPNPALQAKVQEALAAAEDALRALNSVLAAATSLAAADVQAALQSFNDAYAAVMDLLSQVGVRQSASAPRGAYRRAEKHADGTVHLAPPVVLSWLRARGGVR